MVVDDESGAGTSILTSICAKLKHEKNRHHNRLMALSPTEARSLPHEKDFTKQSGQSESIRRVRAQRASDLESLLERTRLSAGRLLLPDQKHECACQGECSCDALSSKSIDSVLEELERQVDLITEQPTVRLPVDHAKKLDQKLETAEKTIELLKLEGSIAHEEKQKALATVSVLEEEKQKALATVSALETSLVEKEGIIREKSAAVDHFTEKLRESQEEFRKASELQQEATAAACQEKKELLETIKRHEGSIKEREQQVTSAGDLACAQEQRIKDLEHQVSLEKTKVSKAETRLEEISSKQKNELHSLQLIVDNGKLKAQELEVALKETQTEASERTKQATDLKDDNCRKSKEIQRLQSELDNVLSARQVPENDVDDGVPMSSLQQAAMESKIRIEVELRTNELERSVMELQEQNTILKEQVSMGQPPALNATEELEKEVADLTARLHVSEQTSHELEAKLAESKQRVEILSEKVACNDCDKPSPKSNKKKDLEASIMVQRKKLSFLKASGQPPAGLEACEEKLQQLENELKSNSRGDDVQENKVLPTKDEPIDEGPLFTFKGVDFFCVEELKKALVEAEKETTELEDEITVRNKYSAEQAAKMIQLTTRIAEHEEIVKDLVGSKNLLEKEVAELKNTISEKEIAIADSRRSNEEMQDAILSRDEASERTTLDLMQMATQQAEKEPTSKEEDGIENLEEDIAHLKMKLTEKESEIGELRNSNDEMRTSLESHRQNLEATKEALEVSLSQLNDQSPSADQVSESLRLEIEQLKTQILEKGELLSNLQTSNAEKETEIETLSKALELSRTDLQALKASHGEVKRSIVGAHLNTAEEEHEEEEQDTHERSEAGRSQQSIVPIVHVPCEEGSALCEKVETDERHDDLFSEAEVTELKEALEQAKKGSLEATQLSATIASLQEEMHKKDHLLEEYEVKVNDLERVIDGLQEQSQQLDQTVSNCKTAILEIESELEDAMKNARLFEERSKEVDSLQVTISAQDAELKKRGDQVESLTVKLQEASKQADVQAARETTTKPWPSLFRTSMIGLSLIACILAYLRSSPLLVADPIPDVTTARKHNFANATTPRQPSSSIPFETPRSGLIPVPPERQKATVVDEEPVFDVRPHVAKRTQNVLHTLLQTSPSASYESTHGPADYEKFRFMKGFRTVAAKTYQATVRTVRRVASQVDEIAVHTQVQDSEFQNLHKAGAVVQGFLKRERPTLETVRSTLHHVAHTELVREIHPLDRERIHFVHSAAAALLEVSQFEQSMLWSGMHPAMLQHHARMSTMPKNATALMKHNQTSDTLGVVDWN